MDRHGVFAKHLDPVRHWAKDNLDKRYFTHRDRVLSAAVHIT